MNPLFEAARNVQQFFSGRGWQSAVIGGLAVQRWGEPRQTRDVDLALLTGFGRESEYIDALLERYRGRRSDARQFALEYRVLLIETPSGVPLDISLAALPVEERILARATPSDFAPGCTVTTCSAEDLIVLKAFADRTQDWLDIEGVLVRQGARLDRDLVVRELLPLLELKEDASPGETLQRLFRKHP